MDIIHTKTNCYCFILISLAESHISAASPSKRKILKTGAGLIEASNAYSIPITMKKVSRNENQIIFFDIN
jgi:hypothetical protein